MTVTKEEIKKSWRQILVALQQTGMYVFLTQEIDTVASILKDAIKEDKICQNSH